MKISYTPLNEGSDCIPDSFFEEFKRRVSVQSETPSDDLPIVSILPPSDTSRAWLKKDPVTGLANGQVRYFDSACGNAADPNCWKPQEASVETADFRTGKIVYEEGVTANPLSVSFVDLGTTDYAVFLDLDFSSSVGSYTISKDTNSFSIDFSSPPAEDGAIYWRAEKV